MKKILLPLMMAAVVGGACAAPAPASVDELNRMSARYAPVQLTADISGLSAGDRKAIAKLVEAARIVDVLQLRQRWSGNEALWAALKKDQTPLGVARLDYFWLNKGPWSILDGHESFLPAEYAGMTIPARKPDAGNFYPAGTSKAALESWMDALPARDKQQAQWFFTTIRQGKDGKFKTVKYSDEYKTELKQLARLLNEAAAATDNASLKKFLTLRAKAFLDNDYLPSDFAWMDLDAPVDVTIGPYETYNDELFGYKAAFEAYVNIRDQAETQKLNFFAKHMQELEDNLPLDKQYLNPKVGALAPMVVVNQVYGGGDGNMGVQTAAYNLPNDERIISARGSKRVMLKNVQEAKFAATLTPISTIVLTEAAQQDLDFNSFFTHILAHEITHGLGPHATRVYGKASTPRQDLKETYSTIEEAKADITGLYALAYMMDKGQLNDTLGQGAVAERKLYNTFLASGFRTLHFGLTDSHARGMAIQMNYLLDKGGFVALGDGKFGVDFSKIKQAVADLDREFLTIEATGDYARAKALIAKYVVIRPEVQVALDKMKAVSNDIRPDFATARALESGAAK
ncbi:dipeptidyl-peptidase 3 family protein [Janthinobacterium agaricidamnosum]|uniref:Nudix hydrolase 3 domain protein n=1 Tax=Janthinobacterium agaricidamnosum NBRC 102515 = DSM 9628 TaxID=1349767 RepID=W0V2B7_9BURK|nr:DNA mismatch repair protein MutT [Janthinobacterium agaricidamnosum]CDG81775.1 nudix hydrolase 3 domain protein [Janthinobacterium agaricidamnosum NBRC 102515 = DSM 9628]